MFKNKKVFSHSILFITYLVFIIYVLLAMYVDVHFIGINNIKVGFASLNSLYLPSSNDINAPLDLISDVLLYISIVSILIPVFFGFKNLLKVKSLFKVDPIYISYIIMGVMFVVIYVVFDKIIKVNYRPIVIEGENSTSFPSTHCLLFSTIIITHLIFINKFNMKANYKYILCSIGFILIITMMVLRILSNQHFISDCIGAILGSLSLSSIVLIGFNTKKEDSPN